jgi:hypothetical protein
MVLHVRLGAYDSGCAEARQRRQGVVRTLGLKRAQVWQAGLGWGLSGARSSGRGGQGGLRRRVWEIGGRGRKH